MINDRACSHPGPQFNVAECRETDKGEISFFISHTCPAFYCDDRTHKDLDPNAQLETSIRFKQLQSVQQTQNHGQARFRTMNDQGAMVTLITEQGNIEGKGKRPF